MSSFGRNDGAHEVRARFLGVRPGWYGMRLWRSYLLSGFESGGGSSDALDEDVRDSSQEEEG